VPNDPRSLGETEILVLLDMCAGAGKLCDERLVEARRLDQRMRISYLQRLKEHYGSMRANLFAVLHERGRTDEEIERQLKQFPERPSIGI
jgi:hypothetical protein